MLFRNMEVNINEAVERVEMVALGRSQAIGGCFSQ